MENRIKTFDGVRAGATAAVFLYHTGYLLTYSDWPIRWLTFVNAAGTVGVSVFFILSAFLLFYQLYKDGKGLDAERLKEYARKRLLRILPLYYFSIFFIVLFVRHDILFSGDVFRTIAYNLAFIRGIKNSSGGGGTIPINPVYWSLVVEMHFYFILPIIYYLFYKTKKLFPFFIMIGLGLIYRALVTFAWGHPTMQFLRFTPANFDFFAFGMLGAYFFVNRQKHKWVQCLGNIYVQTSLFVAFFVFVYFYDLEFRPTLAYIFAPLLLGFIGSLSILSFLVDESTTLAKALTVKPIRFLAKISFSVYIWHPIVIGKVSELPITNLSKFYVSIIAVTIFATISYYLIEAPFLNLGVKKKAKILALNG